MNLFFAWVGASTVLSTVSEYDLSLENSLGVKCLSLSIISLYMIYNGGFPCQSSQMV